MRQHIPTFFRINESVKGCIHIRPFFLFSRQPTRFIYLCFHLCTLHIHLCTLCNPSFILLRKKILTCLQKVKKEGLLFALWEWFPNKSKPVGWRRLFYFEVYWWRRAHRILLISARTKIARKLYTRVKSNYRVCLSSNFSVEYHITLSHNFSIS